MFIEFSVNALCRLMDRCFSFFIQSKEKVEVELLELTPSAPLERADEDAQIN